MNPFTLFLTPTAFSYGLVIGQFDITRMTLLGEGADITYNLVTNEPTGGTLDSLTFSVDVDVTPTGGGSVNVSVPFLILEDMNIDLAANAAETDPDLQVLFFPLLTEIPLQFPFYDLTLLSTLVTAEPDGTVTDAPNPMRAIASTGPSISGTETRDIFNISDVNRRVDTLDGDDVVTTFGDEASIRVLLRRGDDIFFGDDFDISGFSGQTTVVNGGAGADTLVGGYGFDTIRGGKDADVILGMKGDDKLTGGGGDDFIFGSNGDDQIFGGSGKDVLNGGGGNSVMSGGLGRDVFWHETVQGPGFQYDFSIREDGTVIVQDFTIGLDQIYLSDFGTDPVARAQANFDTFMAQSTQQGADTVFVDGQGGSMTLRNVQRDQLTVAEFYDKPWLLTTETSVIDLFEI